ncbi:hypothetical protein PVAND_008740 [Polypedilum vanderplanki]|uniref:Uncharacterized protein n=1 Tax=Polypedilum vanderplanki TaxID=319348 RepID=A0A9J6CB64_POLVA|nr:hypothetical protein PVAND_008740 [Polypedilum vanderplanki]
MTFQNGKFVSYFKINGTPILPPVISPEFRNLIQEIKVKCKEIEEKLQKRLEYYEAKKEEEKSRCSSAHSYTISNPVFPVSQLPEASELSSDNKTESDKETIIDTSLTMQSEAQDDETKEQPEEHDELNMSKKETKNAQNSFEKQSTPNIFDQSHIKQQLRYLIDRQKREYLKTMDDLKRKFAAEQHGLLENIQSIMQNVTSTPMTNTSIALTEDEEFAEFKNNLHNSGGIKVGEKTLINETDLKIKAATTINAYARGYLVRRLMKTKFVQERVKNILETVKYIQNIEKHRSGTPILRNDTLKKKLFSYLQSDLYRVYDIFINYSIKEKMRLIAADRAAHNKTVFEGNQDYLNCSIQTI